MEAHLGNDDTPMYMNVKAFQKKTHKKVQVLA